MSIVRPTSSQPIPKEAKRVFKGKIFDVYQWEQELFDGSKAIFEKLKRPDTAYVIPVTIDKKLILTEQMQPGRTSFIGLLGGRVEIGESPEESARRELIEEAGLEATTLQLWESFQFLPKLDWAIYCFLAKDCRSVGDQCLDAGEKIKLLEVTFDEFIDLVSQENFGDLEIALKFLRISKDQNRLKKTKKLFLE
jgi:ADP-ribose pyrophosphatase